MKKMPSLPEAIAKATKPFDLARVLYFVEDTLEQNIAVGYMRDGEEYGLPECKTQEEALEMLSEMVSFGIESLLRALCAVSHDHSAANAALLMSAASACAEHAAHHGQEKKQVH